MTRRERETELEATEMRTWQVIERTNFLARQIQEQLVLLEPLLAEQVEGESKDE